MRNKLYWGLGVLIVLLIGAFVLVMVNQYAKNRQLERDLAEAVKKLEAHNKEANTPQVVEISDEKPPDEPGFIWVRHGDHWDKVPIDTPDTGHGESHQTQPKTEPDTPPVTTYKNNDQDVDLDYSVFDNPEKLIAEIGEILLNRDKYSSIEVDRAFRQSFVLSDKIKNGYYGNNEYADELYELKNKTYADELLKRGLGISREELRAMIRGERPPIVMPVDPAVFKSILESNGGKN